MIIPYDSYDGQTRELKHEGVLFKDSQAVCLNLTDISFFFFFWLLVICKDEVYHKSYSGKMFFWEFDNILLHRVRVDLCNANFFFFVFAIPFNLISYVFLPYLFPLFFLFRFPPFARAARDLFLHDLRISWKGKCFWLLCEWKQWGCGIKSKFSSFLRSISSWASCAC